MEENKENWARFIWIICNLLFFEEEEESYKHFEATLSMSSMLCLGASWRSG